VIRGKWVLDNVSVRRLHRRRPTVPPLAKSQTRGRCSRCVSKWPAHRKNPVCAGCPFPDGSAGVRPRENFDAIGEWRDIYGPDPVDASASCRTLKFNGPSSLRRCSAALGSIRNHGDGKAADFMRWVVA